MWKYENFTQFLIYRVYWKWIFINLNYIKLRHAIYRCQSFYILLWRISLHNHNVCEEFLSTITMYVKHLLTLLVTSYKSQYRCSIHSLPSYLCKIYPFCFMCKNCETPLPRTVCNLKRKHHFHERLVSLYAWTMLMFFIDYNDWWRLQILSKVL